MFRSFWNSTEENCTKVCFLSYGTPHSLPMYILPAYVQDVCIMSPLFSLHVLKCRSRPPFLLHLPPPLALLYIKKSNKSTRIKWIKVFNICYIRKSHKCTSLISTYIKLLYFNTQHNTCLKAPFEIHSCWNIPLSFFSSLPGMIPVFSIWFNLSTSFRVFAFAIAIYNVTNKTPSIIWIHLKWHTW